MAYKKTNKLLDTGRYRSIMGMNAGLGSFVAALESPKLWVMNVVPTIADISTLGVIYERGLIGMYHDWYVVGCTIASCSHGFPLPIESIQSYFLTLNVKLSLVLSFRNGAFYFLPSVGLVLLLSI
jgi:hypothetical protein